VSSGTLNWRGVRSDAHGPAGTLWAILLIIATPLQALMNAPVLLFLLTLAVMLFRPPDLDVHSADRIAFCLLVFIVLLRALGLRQQLRCPFRLALPMVSLTALATASALSRPFDVGTWSVLTAKFIVPFTFFWLSPLVFHKGRDLQWLERFLLAILAYLIWTALAFLVGAHSLIFPRFILDESLGIHAERARGPFLQAVANGVTLNLLGLFAIERYRRGKLSGIWSALLLCTLPLAIVATKTRAVWVAFAASILWLMLRSGDSRLRRASAALALAGGLGVLVVLSLGDTAALQDRLQENSPVEFRIAAYRAGWSMFLQRPVQGWGAGQLQAELPGQIEGFHGEAFAVHNTYLEMLVEHGLLGFALYVWILVELFRLRGREVEDENDVIGSIRSLWPLLLGVYLVNATFVVMNYQFVNGLLFTFAGILAANPSTARAARR
jgi:putative inorganic carbon (HCO3(-)) transporter